METTQVYAEAILFREKIIIASINDYYALSTKDKSAMSTLSERTEQIFELLSKESILKEIEKQLLSPINNT